MSTIHWKRVGSVKSDNDSRHGAKITKPKNLTGLGVDILFHICSFLSPKDIICLRRCCKALDAVTHERTVWIDSLRHTCLDRGLFLPTFPMNEMALGQLEYAVTSPSRFTALLRRHHQPSSGPVIPISRRVLSPSPLINPFQWSQDDQSDNFTHLCLVPGGRFLITWSDMNLVQLWDLGFMPDMMIKPHPLATMSIGDGAIVQFPPDTQATSDGNGLLIAMSSNQTFYIFEIYPSSPYPYFHQLATLSDLNCDGSCAFMFSSEFLAFFRNRYLLIWNFLLDTWVKWDIDRDAVDIAISREDVIILDLIEISVWRIPPLQPRVHGVEPLADGQKPLVCVPYTTPNILRVALNPSWYLAISPSNVWSVYFDVLHGMDNNSGQLSRYVLHPLQIDQARLLPRYIPVQVEKSRLDNISARSGRNALSVRSGSNDELFLMWREGNMLFIHLSTETTGDGPPLGVVVPISAPTPSLASYGHIACCPASGRIAMVCDDGHIHVIDYIMPLM